MARVDITHHAVRTEVEVGTEVEIDNLGGHQKHLPAVIVPFAHDDPQKLKPRA